MTVAYIKTTIQSMLVMLLVFSGAKTIRAEAGGAGGGSWPIGGQRGTSFEVVISGGGGEASAVLFDCDQLRGQIRIDAGGGHPGPLLEIESGPDVQIGVHSFRLVSGNGVSKAIPVQIYDEPSIPEADEPHEVPGRAQAITWPAMVQGAVSEDGETDFYVLEVPRGEELIFELITDNGLIPGYNPNFSDSIMNLYEARGSWFNDKRPVLLDVIDESTILWWPPRLPARGYSIRLPRLVHEFTQGGLCLIEITHMQGVGNPGMNYLLRINRANRSATDGQIEWTPRELLHIDPLDWEEREFSHEIEPDWLRNLHERSFRTVDNPDDSKEADDDNHNRSPECFMSNLAPAQLEREPNNEIAQAMNMKIPQLVKGIIDQGGDIDHYKFKVEKNQAVAFELRTSRLRHPYFSPRLEILDQDGTRIIDNIYRKVAGDGDDWVKSVEPKTIYTFEKAGEYRAKIQDLSQRRGGVNYAYQFLIRPQIPHAGQVAVRHIGYRGTRFREEVINLKPGATRRYHVVYDQEEGFNGDLAIRFENLPRGVDVLPLTSVDPDVSAIGQVYEFRGEVDKEMYMPMGRQVDTVLFSVSPDASTTMTLPQKVNLIAMPVMGDRMGIPFLAQEIQMMVIK